MIYHGKGYEVPLGTLSPNAGFSISDFGKPQSYYFPDSEDPLPTTLRMGAGLTFDSEKKAWNQHLISTMVLMNASKLTGRKEIKGNETDGLYVEVPPPFRALFNSWGNYEFFNGQRFESYTLEEQIWIHTGVELTFLETFSFRFGRENAAKEEDWLSFRAIGFGIDLYYISLDYTSIKLDSGEPHLYYNFYSGSHWQLTARIPLNGKKPDTLLNQFLNKKGAL